jgi:phosphoribosylglycinamide formyltransferase-1
MKICLLTYDAPHRKTAQIFNTLHNRGFRGVDFLLMPFVKRPGRDVLFAHRPPQFEGPDPRSLAALSGGRVNAYDRWRELLDHYDYFLICGSNLIEADFANSGKILNSHAGLIPACRGLDSFKWAILNGRQVGNTLHIINDEADSGEMVYHLVTPVFEDDDLAAFADRHYQNEIWLMSNFDELLENRRVMDIDAEGSKPTKRMPMEREKEMVEAFVGYKEKFAVS